MDHWYLFSWYMVGASAFLTLWSVLQVINPPGGKRFSFTTRHQSVKQHTWDNFDSARFFQSERCITLISPSSCSRRLLYSTVLSMQWAS